MSSLRRQITGDSPTGWESFRRVREPRAACTSLQACFAWKEPAGAALAASDASRSASFLVIRVSSASRSALRPHRGSRVRPSLRCRSPLGRRRGRPGRAATTCGCRQRCVTLRRHEIENRPLSPLLFGTTKPRADWSPPNRHKTTRLTRVLCSHSVATSSQSLFRSH